MTVWLTGGCGRLHHIMLVQTKYSILKIGFNYCTKPCFALTTNTMSPLQKISCASVWYLKFCSYYVQYIPNSSFVHLTYRKKILNGVKITFVVCLSVYKELRQRHWGTNKAVGWSELPGQQETTTATANISRPHLRQTPDAIHPPPTYAHIPAA